MVAKKEIKKLLNNSSVSLTSDDWVSSSTKNYSGITCRIVKENLDVLNVWPCLKQKEESTTINISTLFINFKLSME